MTKTGALGQVYRSGEVIVREGDPGDCLYVIQEGKVEVYRETDARQVVLAVLGETDFFGEVPLFERQRRSASVRAAGDVRVLTVDRKTLLARIRDDPTLAFRILETMSRRIRQMDQEITRLLIGLDRPSGPTAASDAGSDEMAADSGSAGERIEPGEGSSNRSPPAS